MEGTRGPIQITAGKHAGRVRRLLEPRPTCQCWLLPSVLWLPAPHTHAHSRLSVWPSLSPDTAGRLESVNTPKLQAGPPYTVMF